MAIAKKSPARITLRVVLDHVQGMHREMAKRFTTVETDIVDIKQSMVAMERRLTRQIDGIDVGWMIWK